MIPLVFFFCCFNANVIQIVMYRRRGMAVARAHLARLEGFSPLSRKLLGFGLALGGVGFHALLEPHGKGALLVLCSVAVLAVRIDHPLGDQRQLGQDGRMPLDDMFLRRWLSLLAGHRLATETRAARSPGGHLPGRELRPSGNCSSGSSGQTRSRRRAGTNPCS